MYAIVEIAGQQFKVEEGKKIFVHRLEAEDGKKVEFEKVLLIEDEGKILVGEPTISDAVVEGKVVEHLKGDKVIVFKKKRKKGYRIKNGHRQMLTQIEIISIRDKKSKKASHKKEEAPVAEAVTEEKEKTAVIAEKGHAEKKTAPAKTSEKAAPAKKSSAKKSEEKAEEKKTAAKKTTKK
jgi:large subunit ribosomal protein L21